MYKVLVHTNPDGTVGVTTFADGDSLGENHPDLKLLLEAAIQPPVYVDAADMPQDRLFRGAWKQDGRKCVECPLKSKEIAHQIRRAKREAEFAPYDELVSKQIPGQSESAEEARAGIRAKYDAVQVEMDACKSAAELRAVLQSLVASS